MRRDSRQPRTTAVPFPVLLVVGVLVTVVATVVSVGLPGAEARPVGTVQLSSATSGGAALSSALDGTATAALRIPVAARVRNAVRVARRDAKIPRPLRPTLFQLAGDLGDISDCDYNNGSREVCDRGDVDASRSVAVLGDSHGRHWIPAFDAIGLDHGWRTRYYVKSRCTGALVNPGIVVDGRTVPNEDCTDFHEWALEQIKIDPPEVAIVSTSLPAKGMYLANGRHVTDVDRVAREYRAGLRRLFRELDRYVDRVVLVRDIPKRKQRYGPVQCLEPGKRLGDCLQPSSDEGRTERMTRASITVARAQGVPVVQTRSWFCWRDQCPVVVGRTIVYRDTDHLSASYTAQLAGELARRLELDNP